MSEVFLPAQPTLEDYWRAIILFGRNVASYKFALAKTLLELKAPSGRLIKLEELAGPFSRHICDHLQGVEVGSYTDAPIAGTAVSPQCLLN